MSDGPSFKADLSVDERPYPRYERVYLFLAATFAVLLVLTNIIGIKLFYAPAYEVTSTVLFFIPRSDAGFALTTGILTYPLTFLITDVVSEIYGKKRADFMVGLGFAMSLLMLAIGQLAMWVPAHPYWAPPEGGFYDSVEGYQLAFESIFSLNGYLLLGSMLAYGVAQLIDNWLYHFYKRLTRGKHLWLRNNGSTMVSQLFDTAIVNSILFYGAFGWDFWQGVEVMITIYFYKLMIAALDTPLIYAGVWGLKKMLGRQAPVEEAG
ncbi:MAG: queuosine precursor transporter [Myxococcota bacterium]